MFILNTLSLAGGGQGAAAATGRTDGQTEGGGGRRGEEGHAYRRPAEATWRHGAGERVPEGLHPRPRGGAAPHEGGGPERREEVRSSTEDHQHVLFVFIYSCLYLTYSRSDAINTSRNEHQYHINER